MDDDEISALLTPGQRDYLRGESDIEKGSANERAIRNRIRNRLRQSIRDLAIINEYLETRDLEQAFDLIDLLEMSAPVTLLLDINSRVKQNQSNTDRGDIPSEEAIDGFESIYSSGLRGLYIKRGYEVEEITVDIEIELGDDINEIAGKDLSEISKRQIIQLYEAGEISSQVFFDALGLDAEDLSVEPEKDESN